MKKLISILCVLAMVFSLTACSGDSAKNGGKQSAVTTSLSQNISKNYSTKGNNITFFVCDSKNEKEGILLNLKAPDLLKDLTTIEDDYGGSASRLVNDNMNLRLFRNQDSQFLDAYFSFKGYGEFKIKVAEKIEGEVVSQKGAIVLTKVKVEKEDGYIENSDGSFTLKKVTVEEHRIWAKDKDYIISIDPYGYNGYRIKDEQIPQAYDVIKESFTFAKVPIEVADKNGIEMSSFDINKIKVFGDSKSSVKDWIFASDIFYKHLEEAGISLISSYCLTSEGTCINATVFLKEKNLKGNERKGFGVEFRNLQEDGRTFENAQIEDEFTVKGIKFRVDADGPSRGRGLGFVIKTKTGEEYICSIYPKGSIQREKLEIKDAKAYLEMIIK